GFLLAHRLIPAICLTTRALVERECAHTNMNKNILTAIDKALKTPEPSTSPITDSVVEELKGNRKTFKPEVLRNKKLVDYSDKTVGVILSGKNAGPEKSFTELRNIQTQFDAVLKQLEGVSTTAANAKHRKQASDARLAVATTGEVPADFEVKSLESVHEAHRTARSALMERARALTEQAWFLASPIRATAMNLVADDARSLEESERAQAAT